ncbi:MAG: 4Fe-4S dicluster domain-containing protein [Syntrophobacteraceae bacterium]|nr:4Fe-4S dicluster domain-containing protein [Syntrophobacteraceae bacterium]
MAIEISDKTINHEFIEKINQLSGQDIRLCFQCGTCGGACPMSENMQTLPRRIMRMLQFGMAHRIADVETGWECASCHSCTVSCPRGIDVARVMEAVRLLVLRKNINRIEPSRLPDGAVREMPQVALVSGFRKLTS